MYDMRMTEDRNVLRWGGLAGMAGSLLLMVVFGIVIAFVGMDTVGAEQELMRFPDVRTARVAENGLYLAVLILWGGHLLALYHALRATSRAPALFGSGLGVLGLTMMAAGALVHVATDPIADLYHAAEATPQDQATLALVWQATEGMLDALLVTGLVIVPLGLTALGVAMRGAPAFGKALRRVTVAFGLFGMVAAVVLLHDPVSDMAVIVFFALIAFHAVLGWKTHALSKIPAQRSFVAASGAPR